MDTSIFGDKNTIPVDNDLIEALGEGHGFWKDIRDYVYLRYPNAIDEWKHSGIKYGWSFRIKDRKRVIVYLSPRDKFFKVVMVFGQKAMDRIMNTDISDEIKEMLSSAIVYAEGRCIRIDVVDNNYIGDIKKLIDIKLS